MQSWILANKIYLILIILLDGVVLTYLASKHERQHGQRQAGIEYFWALCKQGDLDGIAATLLTALALLSGGLLGMVLL